MYDTDIRRAAIALLRSGQSQAGVSRSTGISRAALREWLANGVEPKMRAHGCPRCDGALPEREPYVYLLGLYLGDGCISAHARTSALRISCCDDWPVLADTCAEALETVSGRKAFRTARSPRYFFSNVSDDIRRIFTDALDLLDIPWRQNRWNSISVARREAVAALDEFVGPKR